jgi:hypothetical protein
MKVLVDNFATLAMEYCLVDGLSCIFTPDVVMKLDEALINEIAAETEDSRTERERATKKLISLEEGLRTLNRISRQKSAGE